MGSPKTAAAAPRIELPSLIAATMRSRRSPDSGAGMTSPPTHQNRLPRISIPDSAQHKSALDAASHRTSRRRRPCCPRSPATRLAAVAARACVLRRSIATRDPISLCSIWRTAGLDGQVTRGARLTHLSNHCCEGRTGGAGHRERMAFSSRSRQRYPPALGAWFTGLRHCQHYGIVEPITVPAGIRPARRGIFCTAAPMGPDELRHEEAAPMSLRINDEAPNFTAETTQGKLNLHDWIGNGWAVVFSHPKDFTPVCTTELGYMAGLMPEFEKRNTKIIGLSVDPVGDHTRWSKDIEETQGHRVTYPLIGDPELKVAKLYDMLPAEAGDTAQGRTPAQNATVRSVFVVGPDKKIKAMLTYPMTTGRNFDEVLRILDSVQLTAKHQVATPVNWKPGEDVIIAGSVSDEEAHKRFPGFRAPKPYLRYTTQPR